MSKFATRPANVHAPITTTDEAVYTHEGGVGLAYDNKSALFLLAAQNMVSEDTFYESGGTRDARFEQLIHAVTNEDPGWVARFVPYLRDTMQMRSASVVMAAEYVKAGGPHGRQVIAAALSRADEPAEMLAYWQSTHGRNIPKPVKRGVADAVGRLYTERSALRYDGGARTWRFADVIEVVHPTPVAPWQSALFKYLLDARHHGEGDVGAILDSEIRGEIEGEGLVAMSVRSEMALPVLFNDALLRRTPEAERRALLGTKLFTDAGWSWERLSGWLPGGMDAEAWESVIPSMGYMALLRNLRNFDEARVGEVFATFVNHKLANPAEVAMSRQFPFRFYSAFKELATLRWAPALETALDLSLANVPALRGRTLILVDCSGSMYGALSGRSKRQRWELAALFGLALAKRADHPMLVAYGSHSLDYTSWTHKPLLQGIDAFSQSMGGTYTLNALVTHYTGHDRVVILTDEQAHDAGEFRLPDVPIFTFNLAGYAPAHMDAGGRNRYTFGGLTDAAFKLVPMLEGARDGRWPF